MLNIIHPINQSARAPLGVYMVHSFKLDLGPLDLRSKIRGA